jgi:hypothetical protein
MDFMIKRADDVFRMKQHQITGCGDRKKLTKEETLLVLVCENAGEIIKLTPDPIPVLCQNLANLKNKKYLVASMAGLKCLALAKRFKKPFTKFQGNLAW